MLDPRISHNRGYIPHIDPGALTQFITFRLADSMPQTVLKAWQNELGSGAITDVEKRKTIESYLDQNYGVCVLRDPRVAHIVEETLLKWDGDRYVLEAWVIMPNHVHILITPNQDQSVSVIMHSIKSFTAHSANRLLGKKGAFWSKEYFDRYIRDARHYRAVVSYIEENPVKAGLCHSPEQWLFSSAHQNPAEVKTPPSDRAS
jgi:REP element-mobilizing transposase RayT